MYDVARDPNFYIADAAEILDAHGITLLLVDAGDNARDAWSELAAQHGDQIAVAQPRNGELVVSWPCNHKPVAWRIRQAFRAVGMRATWKGAVWDAVHVDLAVRAVAVPA